MRILLVKLALPVSSILILVDPFLGVLIFMLITFVRPETLTWNMLDARFALTISAMTLASWILHSSNPAQRAHRYPAQLWWFLALVLAMTISMFGAESSVDAAWLSVQKFFKYAVFMFLMVQMINTEVRLRMVQEVLFWGVNFLALWGFDQYFRGNYRLEQVGGGDLADSSALAALFNLVFPMAIYRLYHTNKWVRLSGLIFAPLYLIDLTFTESRSGFLGAIAALLIMFALAPHKRRYVLAAIPIGLLLWTVMPASFFDRMGTIFQKDDETETRERSAQQRVLIWRVAVEVVKDHPVLGVGRANFGRIHGEYAYPIWYGRIPDDLYTDLFLRYRVCHNIWLDMLVSSGLAGAIPWLGLMLSVPWTLRKARKLLTNRPMDQYWRYQTHAIEIGMVAYLITGTFQDLNEIEVWYWELLLAGIFYSVLKRRAQESQEESKEAVVLPPGAPRAAVAGLPLLDNEERPVNPWHS